WWVRHDRGAGAPGADLGLGVAAEPEPAAGAGGGGLAGGRGWARGSAHGRRSGRPGVVRLPRLGPVRGRYGEHRILVGSDVWPDRLVAVQTHDVHRPVASPRAVEGDHARSLRRAAVRALWQRARKCWGPSAAAERTLV